MTPDRISLFGIRRQTVLAASIATLVLLGALGDLLSAVGDASAATALKEGDRIVFLGDSITQAGDQPGGYVRLVREKIVQANPQLGIEVVGAGISGHKVPDLQARLDRDVISKKPTIVVIYIGINDVWHSLNNQGTSKQDFEGGLKDLIERIKKAGARVILCTPSVIGEKTGGTNQLDAMLDEYAAISRKVAGETGSQLLDLRRQFLEDLKSRNPENQPRGILTGDGVHLNAAGNQFVAARMLEALNMKSQGDQRLLRHVVLFKFKDGTSQEDIDKVVKAFAALPDKIDVIHDFEWGTDVSTEDKAAGFTHGFLVTFRTAEDRDAYLPHAVHQEFVELVKPKLDNVLVFDYWTGP